MPSEIPSTTQSPAYFLVSVSTRENLELCIRYALAGFPSSENGAWTFCEIEEGDFVSFLYGAKAYNLYRVAKREAIRDAEVLPPWKPLNFRETGRTYSFPFRLYLDPVRVFVESLVRPEFAYVAENLLLRGGHRKTHFQADQTTLQSVSEMGSRANASAVVLSLPAHSSFIPRFTRNRELVRSPEICRFREPILQSAIRRRLMQESVLQTLFAGLNFAMEKASALEILSEKALPQGHLDLLLKQRIPIGSTPKIPMEVKLQRAQAEDVSQLRCYMDELIDDCPIGLLIAFDFGRQAVEAAANAGIRLVRYTVESDLKNAPTFREIYEGLNLQPVGK